MSAYSYIEYPADGQTTTFTFPFQYVEQNEINVFVGGQEITSFTFTSSNTLSISPAPAAGLVVRIQRFTNITERAVDFVNGAVLSEEDLDTALVQVFHAAQEAVDKSNEALFKTPDGKWDGQNAVIKNVADPVDDQDVVNKRTLVFQYPKVQTVADSIASVNTTAANINSVNTTAGSITNVNTVAGSIANVNATGNSIANVNIVAPSIANVNTTAGSIGNVNTVGNNIANVNTVAGNNTRVTTVANNIAAVNAVANDINAVITAANDLNEAVSEIEVVANNIARVDTVGANITNVNTVGNNIANVNATGANIANVNAVAGNATNINAAVSNQANINTVAGISGNVTAVANNASNINAVVANASNINTVAAANSNVNIVAANIADVNNFADTYFTGATAPAGATVGDLWFDTTTNTMKVFSSNGWQAAGSSVNGTSRRQEFVATAGQTTFTVTGGFDAGFVDVYLNGVKLVRTTDFTESGNNIVLNSGAAAGDAVSVVAYGTFTLADHYKKAEVDAGFVAQTDPDGAALLPSGTTAQRPSSPTAGMVRFNTDELEYEVFNGTQWRLLRTFTKYDVEYLVIGGGGGGGFRYYGGGGGAGGYRSSVVGELSGGGAPAEPKLVLEVGTTYSVVVGAGGAGNNGQGGNSSFGSITALGGGGSDFSGGSGGGGTLGNSGGSGTSGQGTNGATSHTPAGGGGGGASQAGLQATSSSPQSGGAGRASSITGTSITRAGGGGGAMNANFAYFVGLGGAGGGGNAAADYLGGAVQATAGAVNTGSGGGGACWNNTPNGAAGGSGIVIVRYLGAQRGTGGTVTSAGGYTIHTFTTSGTFTA